MSHVPTNTFPSSPGRKYVWQLRSGRGQANCLRCIQNQGEFFVAAFIPFNVLYLEGGEEFPRAAGTNNVALRLFRAQPAETALVEGKTTLGKIEVGQAGHVGDEKAGPLSAIVAAWKVVSVDRYIRRSTCCRIRNQSEGASPTAGGGTSA